MSEKTGKGFARQINASNIDKVAPLLSPTHYEDDEIDGELTATVRAPRIRDPATQAAEALFGGDRFKSKRPSPAAQNVARESSVTVPPPPKSSAPSPPTGGIPSAATIAPKGSLVWEKKLSATDAQAQIGNPTGDLRLTKAGFRIGGHVIDQTKYFRNTVFGAFGWTKTTNPQGKRVDEAQVEFDITIGKTHYGRHTLTVSHKPSGESDQGNYTTNVRWGEVANLIRKAKVTGHTLRLYAPPQGHVQPFVIEIT